MPNIIMNRGSLNPTELITKENKAVEENQENETDRRPGKFHRPAIRMNTKGSETYRMQAPVSEIMNKPLHAHKVGENNGNVVLRTEKEERVILVPEKELIIYKRTGQPTGLTIFLTAVIMILGAIIVYMMT